MTQTLFKLVADFETSLRYAVTTGDTTATVYSATDDDGVALPIGLYGFTIDGNSGDKEYFYGTLTGLEITNIFSISRQGTAVAGFAGYHRPSAPIQITDWAALYRITNLLIGGALFDGSTPLGYDSNPTLSDANQFATKGYVDALAPGGTVNADRLILAGQTAGETLIAGDIVYFKGSDQRWWKADADLPDTFKDIQIGIALGAGTAANLIANGVQIAGPCTLFSGLTPGSNYYLSSTAGAVTTTAGTYKVLLGTATSATAIMFNPQTRIVPTLAFGTPTGVIFPYGSSTAPYGFLNCDGTEVSRTTEAALFAVIGTTYGTGDGSTTFNLPNLLSRFPIGYSGSAPTKVYTFASRSSNTITVTSPTLSNSSNNEVQTGQAVLYSAPSGAMTGLTTNTTYYMIRVAYNQFSLATSVALANAGTAIALSSDGTGTQTFTTTYTARPMGSQGGEELHALTDAQMPSHQHDINRSTNTTNNGYIDTNDGETSAGFAGRTELAGSDAMHNIMPLFTTVNYIIKT